MKEITVTPDGILAWRGRRFRCALGRGGVTGNKHEGDGATPAGMLALRRVLYRPDRVPPPETALPVAPLERRFGWCDDPGDAAYNTLVTLPHPARHERLWRDDSRYDVIAVLGWNDAPVRPGRGSAIFLHVAAPGYRPTEGCVALALPDLLAVLAGCDGATRLRIVA
jgi:L,D-peptidoglycan transpeptidase YkuD (ErfK/YbiS/YcfS/YnhG family)